jgi:hypothetical protein
MVINFFCPVCSAPIRGLPDAAAGQRGRCMKCGERIPVPNARRVNDDDIVALLGPVKTDLPPLSESVETAFNPQSDQVGQNHADDNADDNAAEESVAGDSQEISPGGRIMGIISRGREWLHEVLARLQRFDLRSVRRRMRLRSRLHHGERFVADSDRMVLTNQRLLSLIPAEVPALKNIVSAFASDGRTSSDLILHTENERYVFVALERQFAHSVVASIRTMLSIEPGSPTLPKAARETSELFDVVFGQSMSHEPLTLTAQIPLSGALASAMTDEPLADTTTGPMLHRHQDFDDSSGHTRLSAAAKLRKRGYEIVSQQKGERLVRALRNCDIDCLSHLINDPDSKPLRFGALAALRDLGSEATAAIPALQRLLDSDELSITRTDATQDNLLLLTAVSETYLALSNDNR